MTLSQVTCSPANSESVEVEGYANEINGSRLSRGNERIYMWENCRFVSNEPLNHFNIEFMVMFFKATSEARGLIVCV